MYLNSQNKLIFVVFLKKYVAGCLLQSLSRHESETQLLLQWVLNAFCDNLPSEITNLKEVDADFNIELDEIITRVGVKSGESANSLDRNELIEFHLSSLEYYQKSMIHLVLLEVLQCLHPLSSEEGKNQI